MTQITPSKNYDRYAAVLATLAERLTAAPDTRLAVFPQLAPANLQSAVAAYQQSNVQHAEAHLAAQTEGSQTSAVYRTAGQKYGEWQYTVRARYFGTPEVAELFFLPRGPNHGSLLAKLEHFLLVLQQHAGDFGQFLNLSVEQVEAVIQNLKNESAESSAAVQKLDAEEAERVTAKQNLKNTYFAVKHLIQAAYPGDAEASVRDEYLALFAVAPVAKAENLAPPAEAAA